MDKKREKTYIGRVTDKFTKKDLLVAVESVDNKTKKLVNLSLEGKRFSFRHCCDFYFFSNLEIENGERK